MIHDRDDQGPRDAICFRRRSAEAAAAFTHRQTRSALWWRVKVLNSVRKEEEGESHFYPERNDGWAAPFGSGLT